MVQKSAGKNPGSEHEREMRRYFLILLAAVSLAAGCGYSTRSLLPAHLKTLHIEPIKNEIDFTVEGQRSLYIPLLEVKLRNAIIDRYQFDGNLRIAEAGTADLVLKAELREYHRAELRATDSDETEEYRIYIVIDMALYDTRDNELRWEEKGFTGEATFFTTGPRVTSEDSAINEAIEDLARRIVERTIEDW